MSVCLLLPANHPDGLGIIVEHVHHEKIVNALAEDDIAVAVAPASYPLRASLMRSNWSGFSSRRPSTQYSNISLSKQSLLQPLATWDER